MIDYEKVNEYLLTTRKERLMVIYKEGTKTKAELHSLRKDMKAFHFISDSQRLMMVTSGIQAGGIIVEEGAEMSYEDMRYAISRLRTEDPDLIFVMDDKHRERLGDILEEMAEAASDRTITEKLVEKIRFCKYKEKK